MYNKGGAVGGKKDPYGMRAGGETKLKMVKNKDGEEVPFFLADDEGKSMGGKVPGPKGYFKGGKVMSNGKKKTDEKKKPRGKTLLEQKMDAIPSDKARFRGKKPPQA